MFKEFPYGNCFTCGHILGHYNIKGRYDSICHCGCTDWIPQGNLEYLEWKFDQKESLNV
jgi:hypothetical protein